jgi:hypothetical protein
MPAEGQPGQTSDRETFPSLAEDLGEDPARFLDRELIERGPGHTNETAKALVVARIEGIDRVEVARAWRAVERALAEKHDREPRQAIVKRLEERVAWLEAHGDRDDRLGEPRDPEELHERAEEIATESVARWPDRDGSERSAVYRSSSWKTLAADGGESA